LTQKKTCFVKKTPYFDPKTVNFDQKQQILIKKTANFAVVFFYAKYKGQKKKKKKTQPCI